MDKLEAMTTVCSVGLDMIAIPGDTKTTTIAAIIETGFMNLDRDLLTQHPEIVAEGIVQGIECFVNNDSVEPSPVPTFSIEETPSP
jgi:hypothetical protein